MIPLFLAEAIRPTNRFSDLIRWIQNPRVGDKEEENDQLFAKDSSFSRQFVRQCDLRMGSWQGASKEAANSKLLRLLAYKKSFKCTGVRIGDAPLFYRAMNRRGARRRRGPAKILDIDETGVPVKFQYPTFRAARYCVRKKAEEKIAEEVNWNPSQALLRVTKVAPW